MDQPQPEDISSPLRILVLSPDSTPLPSLLSGTCNHPAPLPLHSPPPPQTIAHVKSSRLISTHHIDSNLLIRNPYYSATIPIWHDKLPLSLPELEIWEEEWLKEEAGEVVRAVGAWILVFRKAVNERGGEGELVCKNSFLCLCMSKSKSKSKSKRGNATRARRRSGPGLSALSTYSTWNQTSRARERQAKK